MYYQISRSMHLGSQVSSESVIAEFNNTKISAGKIVI